MATARAIEAARAFVRITGDDSRLRKTLMGVKSSLTGLASSAMAVGKSITLAMMGGTAAGAGAGALMKMAADAEQLAIQMEVLTGSAEMAAATIAELRKMATESPFGAEQLIAGAKTMIQFGVSADKAVQHMRSLSEIAAGDTQRLESLTLAFSQSAAAGRLMGQDVLQMVNAGFNPMLEISRKTGESMLEVKKRMEQGAISFSEVSAAFQSATAEGGRFNGMNSRIMETTSGKFARMTENLRDIGRMIGGILIPHFATLTQVVIDALPAVIKIGQTLGTALVAAVKAFIAAMQPAIEVFQPLLSRARETFSGVRDALVGGDLKLAARIMWLQLKEAWLTGTDAISREWQIWKQGFLSTFSEAVTAVRRMWNQTQNWLSSGIIELMGMIDKSIDVEAVKAELTLMTQEQDRRITQDAERDRAAREAAFESSIGQVNQDLQRARDEYAAAVAEARSKAEQVANEPTAAAVADDKFTQLIETLQAGDIASRMTGSIEQSSQNLRTVSGASVLTRLMNNQQQLDQRQVQLLQQLRDVQRRLVTVTEKGLVAWEV